MHNVQQAPFKTNAVRSKRLQVSTMNVRIMENAGKRRFLEIFLALSLYIYK